MLNEITEILEEWRTGDETAVDRLFPLVYEELKSRARQYLNRERNNHTLQPTALVNEVYIRLVDVKRMEWNDRVHFFAISATIMRRILVDHARRIESEKRGGNFKRLTLENLPIANKNKSADLLDLERALTQLKEIDERKVKVVELRFFGGLTNKESAEVLKVNEKTIQRDWNFARVWLYRELNKSNPPNEKDVPENFSNTL